ncbi:hypothetical protein [Pseudobdellovibrio exovorus]|uniref:Uncharacterized protein n=1 Tax=Pseudobdellovibrio exovorus JSS TaxID=1184267 RepID=M4VE84_9BACT|nr:hypothetical protein [Pseudobdellovibrio exovorus]AGH96805.1 hypothetical protein A11Q_2589 [Pseudobdellovibrio exovorus JSS]
MQTKLINQDISLESPMRIPLIRKALTDPLIQLSPRAIDHRWQSEASLPAATGFNPYSMKIYLPFNSVVFDWLKNPAQSARPFNEDDALIKKLLLVVHDYIHCWSILAVRQLRPDLNFGCAEITSENFEDMVFCHLLTEAAAVAGADYWYWSQNKINDLCPIGTRTNSFAVSYQSSELGEFRKFNPDFNPFHKDFLSYLTSNYCRGDFAGFDLLKIKESPMVSHTIFHEVSYSHSQRLYSRRIISSFSKMPDNFHLSEMAESLKAPVSFREDWKKDLTLRLANLLWNYILDLEPQLDFQLDSHTDPLQEETRWQSHKNHYMYTNVNSLTEEQLQAELSHMEWNEDKYWFWTQYISTFEFSQFTKLELDKIRLGLLIKSQERLLEVVDGKTRLALNTYEPQTLFIPN